MDIRGRSATRDGADHPAGQNGAVAGIPRHPRRDESEAWRHFGREVRTCLFLLLFCCGAIWRGREGGGGG